MAPKTLESKIIELLKERLMSVSELASILKVRRDFLAGYLEALKDQNKLEMVKVGKAHVYRVKKK